MNWKTFITATTTLLLSIILMLNFHQETEALNRHSSLSLYHYVHQKMIPMNISEVVFSVRVDISYFKTYWANAGFILDQINEYNRTYKTDDQPFYSIITDIRPLLNETHKKIVSYKKYMGHYIQEAEPLRTDLKLYVNVTDIFGGRHLVMATLMAKSVNYYSKHCILANHNNKMAPNAKCDLNSYEHYPILVSAAHGLHSSLTSIKTQADIFTESMAKLINGQLTVSMKEQLEEMITEDNDLLGYDLIHVDNSETSSEFYFRGHIGNTFRTFDIIEFIPYRGLSIDTNKMYGSYQNEIFEINCDNKFCKVLKPYFDKQCLINISLDDMEALKNCPLVENNEKFEILKNGILIYNFTQVELNEINSQLTGYKRNLSIEELPVLIHNYNNFTVITEHEQIINVQSRTNKEIVILNRAPKELLRSLHHIQSPLELLYLHFFDSGTLATLGVISISGASVYVIYALLKAFFLKRYKVIKSNDVELEPLNKDEERGQNRQNRERATASSSKNDLSPIYKLINTAVQNRNLD